MAAKKQVGKYEIGRTLGEGTFGKVKHAVHVSSRVEVAIKVLDKERIQKQSMGSQIKKEISIMKQLSHENVVKLKEVLASRTFQPGTSLRGAALDRLSSVAWDAGRQRLPARRGISTMTFPIYNKNYMSHKGRSLVRPLEMIYSTNNQQNFMYRKIFIRFICYDNFCFIK